MSHQSALTSRIKIGINIVTFSALALLVYASWDQILAAFSKLADLRFGLLLLLLPLQILSYTMVSRIYYTYFRNSQQLGKLRLSEMYKIALELNFINNVFPSGGVSGFSYLGLRLRPLDITVAASTLAQMVRFLLTFASFLLFLALGLVLLAAENQVSGLVILIGSSVFSAVIFGVLLGWYLIISESRIKALVAALPKIVNIVSRRLKIAKKDLIDIQRIESGLGELHRRYMELQHNWRRLKEPFIFALLANFCELLTIYVVYIAFGEWVNPGAIILAYAVANFAGLIAILPGGVGVYESLMTAVLAASGVDKGLAISATLVYRVLSLSVLVPVGFWLYHQALNRHKVEDITKNA